MTLAKLSANAGIPLKYANRHGLITGQTGTGKTVSLMRLAESFSSQGVPVFVSDVKGDIGALSRCCPVAALDVFGETGQPLQTTISAMGPDLMARALELSDIQAGCLEIAFHVASVQKSRLDTIGDLRGLLAAMLESPALTADLGQVSRASIGVIQRSLLRLETQGAAKFFNAPGFDVARLLETQALNHADMSGKTETLEAGLVSILDATRLIQSPRVYGAFLLWLLSDLWQRLPEVGDLDKPRLVMFFDEAHLLFSDCPAPLLRRIEQTVRLIRSKGVGVYFVSQAPDDVPTLIRSQLAHTIAHDRALPVGAARFATMTATGNPAKPMTVRVALPSCDLGPLTETESAANRPALPEVGAIATPGMNEWLLPTAITVMAILVLSAAAYWLGGFGKAIAVIGAIGMYGAMRR